MKNIRKNSGITLVALVVTIIIILILAGIAISSLTNTGIFQITKDAKQKHEEAELDQNTKLDQYESKIDEYLPDNKKEKAGLYDKDNNLLATWEEAEIDIERFDSIDYDSDEFKNYYLQYELTRIENEYSDHDYGSGSGGETERDLDISYIVNKAPKNSAAAALIKYPTTTKIIIPDGVKKIGCMAFMYCNNLTEIKIPNSVTKIGEDAFNLCYNLKTIEIPNSVTYMGDGTFSGCRKIDNVKLSNNINSISVAMFCNCKSLKTIQIPNNVKNIESVAFNLCKNLEQIEIPDSVTEIGHCAFLECDSLITAKLPSNLTKMGPRVFYFDKKLNTVWYKGTKYTNKKMLLNALKNDNVELEKLSDNSPPEEQFDGTALTGN